MNRERQALIDAAREVRQQARELVKFSRRLRNEANRFRQVALYVTALNQMRAQKSYRPQSHSGAQKG